MNINLREIEIIDFSQINLKILEFSAEILKILCYHLESNNFSTINKKC